MKIHRQESTTYDQHRATQHARRQSAKAHKMARAMARNNAKTAQSLYSEVIKY